MDNSSLLTNVSMLTKCDYESIVQSLITNVDLVWINALAFEINKSEMVKKLCALKEAGLVRIWDYEMGMSKHSIGALNKVLTVEEYKNNSEYLDAMMPNLVESAMGKPSDFTTFNIESRNMLSNFLIAKNCGATSVIQRNSIQNVLTGKQDVFQLYADCLFNQTNIRSVSSLTVEKIIQLRKYSQHFRNKIQEQIDNHLISGNVPLPIIKQDCEQLSKEYCEEINSRIGGSPIKGIALDIASFWIVPVTIFSIAQKLWDTIFNRKQRGFVMYLTTLQNSGSINNM